MNKFSFSNFRRSVWYYWQCCARFRTCCAQLAQGHISCEPICPDWYNISYEPIYPDCFLSLIKKKDLQYYCRVFCTKFNHSSWKMCQALLALTFGNLFVNCSVAVKADVNWVLLRLRLLCQAPKDNCSGFDATTLTQGYGAGAQEKWDDWSRRWNHKL